MEAEEILKLYDSWWFEREIFTHKHDRPAPPSKFGHQRMDQSQEQSVILDVSNNLQIRSFSDRCLGRNIISSYFKELEEAAARKEASSSPRTVIIKPKLLQKILSGKEIIDFSKESSSEQEKPDKTREKKEYCSKRNNKGRKGMRRSLSALEFEEVKGFMDLGFVFDEDDRNSSLVSIIPGLQKLGKMGVDDEQVVEVKGDHHQVISRPYLSEAWGVSSKRRGLYNNSVMKWRIPSAENQINMKDHLRIWAQNVASTVR